MNQSNKKKNILERNPETADIVKPAKTPLKLIQIDIWGHVFSVKSRCVQKTCEN